MPSNHSHAMGGEVCRSSSSGSHAVTLGIPEVSIPSLEGRSSRHARAHLRRGNPCHKNRGRNGVHSSRFSWRWACCFCGAWFFRRPRNRRAMPGRPRGPIPCSWPRRARGLATASLWCRSRRSVARRCKLPTLVRPRGRARRVNRFSGWRAWAAPCSVRRPMRRASAP
jgi:hypothetical protein